MEGVRRWWQELTGLVLPAECGGCGRARTVLCPECSAALCGTAPRRVRPVPEPPGLPAVHAAARYADEVRAVLLAHKERGALALARPLGVALAGAVRVGLGLGEVGEGEGPPPPGHVLLVPVPSTPRAVRARGHDPARRIALAAAAELRRAGASVRVAAVLRQRRVVADQSGLNSRQRLENLVGALGVVPGGARVLRGGRVVLVDDLVTTGASLAEAARAVRAAVAAERPAGTVETERTAGTLVAERIAGMAETERPARTLPEERPAGTVAAEAERTARMAETERPSATVPGTGRPSGTVAAGTAAGAVAWTERSEGAMAVYGGVTREVRGVRPSGAREGGAGRVPARPVGAGGAGEVVCAAVVAAPPDSFEINRNWRRT
ncbi:ComF family protein [Streptomyces sp. NPDC014995]|uniref:ComF family protein n=1 Tax=Streptomyces sp. NPDC014995 TaxID=3364936 RepID=UPI003700FF4E